MEKMNEEQTNFIDSRKRSHLFVYIYAILFILGLWGCLAVYNATVYSHSPFHFAIRQFIWLLIGIVVLIFSSRIPFPIYKKYAFHMGIVAYFLLVVVLFFGIKVNGMRGWFDCGAFYFQPSEIAKPVFILLLCILNDKSQKWVMHLLVMLSLTVFSIIPIAFEPDYGMIMIYAAGFIIVYFLGGGSSLIVISAVLLGILMTTVELAGKSYIMNRFLGFINPSGYPFDIGWHIMQFKYTLARGGFWGTSWGNSFWSNAYLPLAYNDSAFAALTEAIGFVGVLPVLLGFSILPYIGYRLSCKIKDNCAALFIISMLSLILFQALIHISVNTGLFPPTGITLPMFSYGGSSLVSTMFGAGIILSAASGKENNSSTDKLRFQNPDSA